MQPSMVDLVIRLAIWATRKMDKVPTTATAKRQPNGVSPNSHSPTAMSTLPSGGCTTYSPVVVRMWVPPCASNLSTRSRFLLLSTALTSTPCFKIP